jgi:hypothetical protein
MSVSARTWKTAHGFLHEVMGGSVWSLGVLSLIRHTLVFSVTIIQLQLNILPHHKIAIDLCHYTAPVRGPKSVSEPGPPG